MPDNTPFDTADAEYDADFWKKELKIKFNRHDVIYWFNATEAQLTTYGVRRQWDKKNAIIPMLPEDVVEELMHLLRLP